MTFTRIDRVGQAAVEKVSQQSGGSHADEIETSMMLYIAPERVDMTVATRDFNPGAGPLTPQPGSPGIYSASGVYGDATLASREKGQRIVEAMVADILLDIGKLKLATLPPG